MSEEHDDADRRTVLKGGAALGALATGLSGAVGSAAAQRDGTGGSLFRNLDATGVLLNDADDTFDGTLHVTNIETDGRDLTVEGLLKGTATRTDGTARRVTQRFSVTDLIGQVLGVLRPDSSGECPILELDLGPIFLDLLGLRVDLSPVELDITAVAGPGNLLGNLFCAVARLLDPQ